MAINWSKSRDQRLQQGQSVDKYRPEIEREVQKEANLMWEEMKLNRIGNDKESGKERETCNICT